MFKCEGKNFNVKGQNFIIYKNKTKVEGRKPSRAYSHIGSRFSCIDHYKNCDAL